MSIVKSHGAGLTVASYSKFFFFIATEQKYKHTRNKGFSDSITGVNCDDIISQTDTHKTNVHTVKTVLSIIVLYSQVTHAVCQKNRKCLWGWRIMWSLLWQMSSKSTISSQVKNRWLFFHTFHQKYKSCQYL